MKNKKALILCALAALGVLATGAGCANQEAVKTAIIAYLETNGQKKAGTYLDQLVADGRLGSANAEAIKEAIPGGIEKVKEVINKIGESEK